jgi:adenosylcobinamide-GDP ribazoletransferase
MFTRIKFVLSFLTIIPVDMKNMPESEVAASSRFFPLAGWLIGSLIGLLAFLCIGLNFPFWIIAVLLTGFQAWITRGLHLDGLADLLDGLGGAYEPEKRLQIMKDSATGAFGVIGLVLILFLKISALAAIFEYPYQGWLVLIILPPVAARWTFVFLAYKSKYPREKGTGHQFIGKVNTLDLGIATMFMVPFLGWWQFALPIITGSILPGLILRQISPSAIGGITGDVLGASCELGEALGWVTLAVIITNIP